jgi:uncharacterized membrane protein
VNPQAIFFCFICQLCLVSGQLFFKHAMSPASPQRRSTMAWLITAGIGTQAIWFFLWTRLMERWNLSQLYPFEGLNPAILAILAAIVLKERLPWVAWAGLGLICVGIGIVSTT